MVQYSPVPNLVVSASGLIGKTFGSHIDVNGSGPAIGAVMAVGGYADYRFAGDLGNSPIFKLGLAADYAVTQNVHVTAAIDYTSFNFGASDVYGNGDTKPYIWEPRSDSNLTTFKIGLGYSF